ncbi:uncharacterized protein [Diadema antillarum]|uniref:uncharacterized protein n=1 Tax=Diadema antillarum TaxID=105358 RepID=UPI003A88EB5B
MTVDISPDVVRPGSVVGGLGDACDTMLATILVVSCFVACKSSYDCLRRWRGKLNVVVIGCGPVGLTAALIAVRGGRAKTITVYEEKTRSQLMERPHQIGLDTRSVGFLRKLGVDFDNMEGCWHQDRFYTRIGIFQEYVLSLLQQLTEPLIDIRLGTKFGGEMVNRLSSPRSLTLVIAADGLRGVAANALGMSDEFIQESCKSFCAVCSMERDDQPNLPTPETRVFRLKLDLSAFGVEFRVPDISRAVFYLKIFGTFRNRYMKLMCHRGDSNLVRQLRLNSDPMLMRNIFQESFNTYKTKGERKMSDVEAMKLRCSSRLTEVKMSYRREPLVYIEDEHMVVSIEGDASRSFNYSLGFELNTGLRGLECLDKFINQLVLADGMDDIVKTLSFKSKCTQRLNDDMIRHKLHSEMNRHQNKNDSPTSAKPTNKFLDDS